MNYTPAQPLTQSGGWTSGPGINRIANYPFLANNSMDQSVGQWNPDSNHDAWAQFRGAHNDLRQTGHSAPQEHATYPEAFNGFGSSDLSLILINEITADDSYLTNEVLPWAAAPEGQMNKTFDVWEFHDHMLSELPEEAVPRLLRYEKRTGTFGMKRYGIGVHFEDGYLRTPAGRINFMMNIQQIKNAIVESNNLGAANAIMDCDPVAWERRSVQKSSSKMMSTRDYEALLSHEIDMFAILHKKEDGLDNMISRLRDILSARKVRNPNYTILPQGALKFCANREENTKYLISGKPHSFQPEPQVQGRYGKIRESRLFNIGEREPSVDPFYSPAVIGTHAIANNETTAHIPAEHFRTAFRTVGIYDEDRDQFVDIPIQAGFANCGLFVWPDGDTANLSDVNNNDEKVDLTHLGKVYFGAYRSWGELFKLANMQKSFVNWICKEGNAAKYDEVMKCLGYKHSNAAQLAEEEKKQKAEAKANANTNPSGAGTPAPQAQPRSQQEINADKEKIISPAYEKMIEEAKNLMGSAGYNAKWKTAASVQSEFGDVFGKWAMAHYQSEVQKGTWPAPDLFKDVNALKATALLAAKEANNSVSDQAFDDIKEDATKFLDASAAYEKALRDSLAITAGKVRLYHSENRNKFVDVSGKFSRVSQKQLNLYFRYVAQIGGSQADEWSEDQVPSEVRDLFIEAEIRRHNDAAWQSDEGVCVHAWLMTMLGLYKVAADYRDVNNLTRADRIDEFRHKLAFATIDDAANFKDMVKLVPKAGSRGALTVDWIVDNYSDVITLFNEIVEGREKRDDTLLKTAVGSTDTGIKKLTTMMDATPITDGKLFYWCVQNDVNPPLSFIYARHMARYEMGTAVHMVAGSATGNTWIGNTSWKSGRDPNTGVATGNFTGYFKSMIMYPHNIAHARNCYSRACLGGYGTTFWHPLDDRQAYMENDISRASIHCMAVPVNWVPRSKFLSLTGFYNPARVSDVDPQLPHYPSASIYARHWGWKHERFDDNEVSTDVEPQKNMITVQGTTWRYQYKGDGQCTYDSVVMNKGHWGPEYQGCHRVRKGIENCLRPVNYGDTNVMSIV